MNICLAFKQNRKNKAKERKQETNKQTKQKESKEESKHEREKERKQERKEKKKNHLWRLHKFFLQVLCTALFSIQRIPGHQPQQPPYSKHVKHPLPWQVGAHLSHKAQVKTSTSMPTPVTQTQVTHPLA